MAPSVSVVIPTHNRAGLVGDAVASLLDQGELVPEIVVVDDGSTDDTERVLARFGDALTYVRREHGGPGAARNTGIARARGSLLAFLDSDNLCTPGGLDHRSAILTGRPDVDLVIGRTQVAVARSDERGRVEYVLRGAPYTRRSLSATMVRRRALERIGPFDERLRFGEDDDWFMRAAELGMHAVHDDRTCQVRRVHAGNLTHARAERTQALLGLLKNRLDRGRADASFDLSRSATDSEDGPTRTNASRG